VAVARRSSPTRHYRARRGMSVPIGDWAGTDSGFSRARLAGRTLTLVTRIGARKWLSRMAWVLPACVALVCLAGCASAATGGSRATPGVSASSVSADPSAASPQPSPGDRIWHGVDQTQLQHCMATEPGSCLQTVAGLDACMQMMQDCNEAAESSAVAAWSASSSVPPMTAAEVLSVVSNHDAKAAATAVIVFQETVAQYDAKHPDSPIAPSVNPADELFGVRLPDLRVPYWYNPSIVTVGESMVFDANERIVLVTCPITDTKLCT
jgi:hypothetical protein